MIHNGTKLRKSSTLGYRMSSPVDRDLDGNPMESCHVAIVYLRDCDIYEKNGKTYYKPVPEIPCIPMNHGGTYYGYGKPMVTDRYTERRMYLVDSGKVYTGMIRTENKKFIAEQERVIAAKYFTISNLAMEPYMEESGNDLDRAFDTVEGIIHLETGCTVDEEFRDWKKMIDNGDRYCFDEWQKIRTKYVK